MVGEGNYGGANIRGWAGGTQAGLGVQHLIVRFDGVTSMSRLWANTYGVLPCSKSALHRHTGQPVSRKQRAATRAACLSGLFFLSPTRKTGVCCYTIHVNAIISTPI